jgi:macrolide transport system ATP-binding/permease protein
VGKPYNGEHNEVNARDVSPDYFTTIQARLLRGRYLAEADDATRPSVVLINKMLADTYFPGEDPVGRKLGNGALDPKSIREIVGVVDDVRDGSLDAKVWPAEYQSIYQDNDNSFSTIVRTSQDPGAALRQIRSTIHQVDQGAGLTDEMTMQQRISDSPSAALHRSSAWLVGGFAALALLLSAIGLYGVIAYSVSQRTREIGVRMALGAQRASVYLMIIKEAGWLIVLGISAGLVCSIGTSSLMSKVLFGVKAWDGATLSAVAAVLAIAAVLASYFPARRAASVNPVEALRAE